MDSLLNAVLYNIVNPALYLFMAVAMVVFIWGMLTYLYGEVPTDKHEEGQKRMIWGAVGLAIMVCAAGIVKLLLTFVR
jgi:membrane protein DedA with SNARE-associated domain